MQALTLILFVVTMATAFGASMKLYEKLDGEQTYQRVLVPVSSTVIPLDDLPEYQVGIGLGFQPDKNKIKPVKPDGKIELLTINNKKNYSKKEIVKKTSAAAVEEIEN